MALESSDKDLAAIIGAIDRCEHGRHHNDPCTACKGGHSTGNLFLTEGQRIGTSLYGVPIVVPPWPVRRIAAYWLPESERSHSHRVGPV